MSVQGQNLGLLATYTPTVLLQSLILTADFIMLYTGNTLLAHGTIMSHPVFGEFPFFLNQDIEHHPHHGKAKENNAYEKDL